VSAERHWFF